MKLVAMLTWATGLACCAAVAAETGTTSKQVRINLDEPTSTGTTAAPAKATPGKSTVGTKAPANAQPKKSDKAGKEKGPPPEVAGYSISRGEKGFLGLKIEGNAFKAYFYDKDKKPVSADVAGVALRWPVQYQPNPERTVLAPTGDGKVMTSDKTVRPPFHFKLFVTLLKSTIPGDDPGTESYVVDFAQ